MSGEKRRFGWDFAADAREMRDLLVSKPCAISENDDSVISKHGVVKNKTYHSTMVAKMSL